MKGAESLGRSELFIGEIAEWLRGIYDVCISNYAPSLLADEEDIPENYLELLLSGPRNTYWLWPSQIGALDSGLLDRNRFAVSLPPSAGKTFLAELKIVQRNLRNCETSFLCGPSKRLLQGKLRPNLPAGCEELR